MNAERRFSKCIDCECTIIGDALRCFGCHDAHAREIEVRTTPYVRQEPNPVPSILTRWLVTAEVAVIIVLGFALALKECIF